METSERGILRKDGVVLEMLNNGGPMFALEMVSECVGLSRSTIYARLAGMEEAGWISGEDVAEPADAGRPRRRLYRITEAGRRRMFSARAAVIGGNSDDALRDVGNGITDALLRARSQEG